MSGSKETITVHVNVDITPEALQSIVENAKNLAGRNEKGHYKVDTADKVSEMISRFLLENDFESFTQNIENYAGIDTGKKEK
ncbi:MAG: hypothetical protein JRI91_10470 [Deltaproteobacteria bacterium]|nr:hypothetical protein [Deltaproteobacteria bacterium]